MFDRANAALGANWSLHDLRHTAAYRMARDPQLPLTDVQWVLGHAHLSTTQLYLNPLTEDVIAERARLPRPAGARAARLRRQRPGYRAESLETLFGEDAHVTGQQRRSCRPAATGAGAGAAVTPTGAELLGRVPAAARRDRSWPATEASRGRRCWPACSRRRSRWTTGSASRPAGSGVLAVLSWLQAQPGSTWQERWQASGAEDQPDWRDLVDGLAGRRRAGPAPGTRSPHLSPGLLVLICADVIRPEPYLAAALRAGPPRPGRRDGPHPRQRRRSPRSPRCASRAASASDRAAGADRGSRDHGREGRRWSPTSRVGDCVELLEVAAGCAPRPKARAHSPLLLPTAARPRRARRRRAGGAAGVLRPRPAQLRAADRPLPDRLPAGARRARGLPAPNASRRWTSPRCSASPTCSASCSGPTWRRTIPASTRSSSPARWPPRGSSG